MRFKLGDVARFIDYRGKTPPKTTQGIPLVTAKIVKDNVIQTPTEFIAEDFYDEWMRRGIPQKGDVVFTTEAPLGDIAQIKTEEKLAFAQRIIILQGEKDWLDNDFLFYSLQYEPMRERIQARSTGTTVVGIKAAELRQVEIDLPDLATQRSISITLRALDDKIANNLKINHHLVASRSATDSSPDIKRGKRVSRSIAKRIDSSTFLSSFSLMGAIRLLKASRTDSVGIATV